MFHDGCAVLVDEALEASGHFYLQGKRLVKRKNVSSSAAFWEFDGAVVIYELDAFVESPYAWSLDESGLLTLHAVYM